jgi:hypothetical protein
MTDIADTCIPREYVERIVIPLFRADLEASLDAMIVAFDRFVGGPDERLFNVLAKALADEIEIPQGTVVFGPDPLVWGNPQRITSSFEHVKWAWRCGCCRWTGSNYATEIIGRSAALEHAAEHGVPLARPEPKHHADAA